MRILGWALYVLAALAALQSFYYSILFRQGARVMVGVGRATFLAVLSLGLNDAAWGMVIPIAAADLVSWLIKRSRRAGLKRGAGAA